MSLRFYDRAGRLITMPLWNGLMYDAKYAMVAHTWVVEDKVRVSTIWRGGPFSTFSRRPPEIFETIIFGQDDEILEQVSYVTEAGAIAGHDQAVARAREKYVVQ